MATRNIQMNILTDSGSYDVLYPQTTASQAGARPSTWMPTASDVGALPISGGTLTGNLTIKGGGNYGMQINLGDGDYVHIAEPTDDCMEIKAKKINLVTSDTTSAGLTWNNNALGNGDLILEQGTRIGNGASYLTTTNGIQLANFSKITNLLFFSYGGTSLNPYYLGYSENDNNVMTKKNDPGILHTFIKTNGGYTSNWQFAYQTNNLIYDGIASFYVSYNNKIVKAWMENVTTQYTINDQTSLNNNGITYNWWAIGY